VAQASSLATRKPGGLRHGESPRSRLAHYRTTDRRRQPTQAPCASIGDSIQRRRMRKRFRPCNRRRGTGKAATPLAAAREGDRREREQRPCIEKGAAEPVAMPGRQRHVSRVRAAATWLARGSAVPTCASRLSRTLFTFTSFASSAANEAGERRSGRRKVGRDVPVAHEAKREPERERGRVRRAALQGLLTSLCSPAPRRSRATCASHAVTRVRTQHRRACILATQGGRGVPVTPEIGALPDSRRKPQ
jgi:hypothetical protein